MKIRGKLIMAFFIMTIFPTVLMFFSVTIILIRQSDLLADSYQLEESSYKMVDIVLNPAAFFYYISQKDYESISRTARENPDKFLDMEFLENTNQTLMTRYSFLMVAKEGEFSYIGNRAVFQSLSDIPLQKTYDQNAKYLTYIDQNATSVIKERCFFYSDQTLGQVFLVTDFSRRIPSSKKSMVEIVIAFLVILLATGTLLVFWIYRSILRPLNTLQLATTQIGEGNLDKPIPMTSKDEIGQLCKDFEEMRIRLREMIDQGLRSEENIREIMVSISHDLKTPVTAIQGYTEGILDGVADTPEKRQKYLQTIYAKTNDITYLIDELSLFSQVERNSLAYHFVTVNLECFFADCIEDISLDLESKNVTVEYYNTSDTSTQVLIDIEQMKRVLHNIIENAVKYNDNMEKTIAIRLEDYPVEPSQTPDEFVLIQIEDNGSGIAAKDLPYIFDRFYRADSSRNSSKRGSGLGLAIVKRIISDHDGTVWAESTEGVGSSIYFTVKKAKTP